VAIEKREKDSSCDTCNRTKPLSNQEGEETRSQERIMMSFYHIKNRFSMSIVPDWLQQWALGTSDDEDINPASVVAEGNSSVSVEIDFVRRKA
jgi:hypothetical protein